MCANLGAARLVRSPATHCAGPLDLVTNPPRHNGSDLRSDALKRFLGKTPNAVRLQIITALIAFVALRLLQQASQCNAPLKRMRAVAKNNIFNLSGTTQLLAPNTEKPPDFNPNQLTLIFPDSSERAY